MSTRESKEREQLRQALRVDYDLIREDERMQVRLAQLEAEQRILERIAELRRECRINGANPASFAG